MMHLAHTCYKIAEEYSLTSCTHTMGAFSHSACTACAQRQLLRCLPQ